MNTKILFSCGILPLLLLLGCGKETKVVERIVIEKVIDPNTQSNTTNNNGIRTPLAFKTKANIVYSKMRKTSLVVDDRGNIKNFEKYMRDFNKRKIVVTNEGRPWTMEY